uniref:Putative ovule protein n=1 Tax=Solanum chacoense TaxID=4108 RepID=A0A0V0GW03_SOLCH
MFKVAFLNKSLAHVSSTSRLPFSFSLRTEEYFRSFNKELFVRPLYFSVTRLYALISLPATSYE